jgi:hypothetical protein
MISANPNLTGQQAHDMLEQSADDLGSAGWDSKYGYGRVNAAKAVAMALSTTSDITPPTVSITSPTAGSTVAGTVTVQANASDNVGVSSVSYYLDSSTTAFATVASPYSASWNTASVANGSHTITAVAVDPTGNAGSSKVTVSVNNTVAPVNQAPTVASPAAANSNPVTGASVGVSVLGGDDGGESSLVYSWSASGPAAVSFSANGTNAAKTVTASFSKVGSYALTVTIKDTAGLTVSSTVTVSVNQTPSSVSVFPASASVAVSQSQQFTATFKDQFGAALASQPACAWSVTGGGTIGSSGVFTASVAGGPFTVSAAAAVSGNGSVTVTAPPPPPDTTAPTVSITSPTGGTVSSSLTVTASASDNAGVVKVELWVDGKLQSTDTASPWGFSINTKGWKRGSTHKLVCKAYDAAGNVGTSATVSLSK